MANVKNNASEVIAEAVNNPKNVNVAEQLAQEIAKEKNKKETAQRERQNMIKQSKTASHGKVCVLFHNPTPIAFTIQDNHGLLHEVVINGSGQELIGAEQGSIPVGTPGKTYIDEELWDAIVAKYDYIGYFQKGLIYAVKPGQENDAAKANKDLRSGDEPIDPKTLRTEESK